MRDSVGYGVFFYKKERAECQKHFALFYFIHVSLMGLMGLIGLICDALF